MAQLNKHIVVWAAIYIVTMVALAVVEDYAVVEPLFILFVFGGLFPMLAYITTRGHGDPTHAVLSLRAEEYRVLGLVVLGITLYLTWGLGPLDHLAESLAPIVGGLYKVVKKVIIFVVAPYLIFSRLFNYTRVDYGLTWRRVVHDIKRYWLMIVVLSGLFMAFNLFLGSGARPIRDGLISGYDLAWVLPLTFIWLIIEVGLVEEFFFRGLLQPRVAAYFKSQIAGIFYTALIFGVAHAPGLYLRGADMTVFGAEPSILMAVGYSIVIIATAGLAMGYIWARTKSLTALIIIHAAGDLMPMTAEMFEVFKSV